MKTEFDTLNTDYIVGVPFEEDTPQAQADRARMWAAIQQKIRRTETWGQRIRRWLRRLGL